MTMARVFNEIYQTNAWNGVESRSGPGSGPQATAHVAKAITDLVSAMNVKSVLDVGCGDNYWLPDLPNYLGIDVAPEAIDRAKLHHPDRRYMVADVRNFHSFMFDLVIIRDALQHLPLADGKAAVDAITSSDSRLLLASTYVGGENIDIRAGDAYSPDLEQPPFSLGEPELRIFDGYTYHDQDAVRDARKHLGLWRLR